MFFGGTGGGRLEFWVGMVEVVVVLWTGGVSLGGGAGLEVVEEVVKGVILTRKSQIMERMEAMVDFGFGCRLMVEVGGGD